MTEVLAYPLLLVAVALLVHWIIRKAPCAPEDGRARCVDCGGLPDPATWNCEACGRDSRETGLVPVQFEHVPRWLLRGLTWTVLTAVIIMGIAVVDDLVRVASYERYLPMEHVRFAHADDPRSGAYGGMTLSLQRRIGVRRSPTPVAAFAVLSVQDANDETIVVLQLVRNEHGTWGLVGRGYGVDAVALGLTSAVPALDADAARMEATDILRLLDHMEPTRETDEVLARSAAAHQRLVELMQAYPGIAAIEGAMAGARTDAPREVVAELARERCVADTGIDLPAFGAWGGEMGSNGGGGGFAPGGASRVLWIGAAIWVAGLVLITARGSAVDPARPRSAPSRGP